MSDHALQIVAYIVGLVDIALASFILLMDARRFNNVILTIYLAMFALNSLGVATLRPGLSWTRRT